MYSSYQFIASSITDLARQQSVRGAHEINNDIIQTTTQKLSLEERGVDDGLISAYTQKITDLQEERKQAIWLKNRIFTNYDAAEISTSATNTTSSVCPNIPFIDANSSSSKLDEASRRIRRHTGRPSD